MRSVFVVDEDEDEDEDSKVEFMSIDSIPVDSDFVDEDFVDDDVVAELPLLLRPSLFELILPDEYSLEMLDFGVSEVAEEPK